MSKTQSGQSPGRPLVVLVADEEPGIRELLHDYLAEMDIHTLGASNGAETLLLLKQHSVDMVLIDLELRNGTAAEVFAQAIAQKPELRKRFIFMGAASTPLSRTEHGCPLISKPFRMEDLTRTILSLCAQGSAHAQSLSNGAS